MLSHVNIIKTDIQGPFQGTEKLKESQGHYQNLNSHRKKRNQDQDHPPETSHQRKGQSHVARKDAAKEVYQSHNHLLVHTAVDPGLDHLGSPSLDHLGGPGLSHLDGPGLGHLDAEDHALGHVENHLHLGILEGFPLLIGKEVRAHSEDVGQDHAPGLVDRIQEEEVLQGGGSHVQDLEEEDRVQGQDRDYEVGDLGHEAGDHVPHPEIKSEKDQGQNHAHTQETEEEAGARADLGQSQKMKHCPATPYQLPV